MSTASLSQVSSNKAKIDANNITKSDSKVDATAKKIHRLVYFGLTFLTIGLIAISIATFGLNQIVFHATIATLDTVLGMGSISLSIGGASIIKALFDRKSYIYNPKRYGLVGIKNPSASNCWLNSLMQMLLNVPDIKSTLGQNSHFKKFIDDYEKDMNENRKPNANSLKEFLKTICPDLNSGNNFHDVHEVLNAILNMCKGSNRDLQNSLTEKKHYSHSDGSRSISDPQRLDNTGSIVLDMPPKLPRRITLHRLFNEFFSSQLDASSIPDIRTVYRKKTYLLGFLKRDVPESVAFGEKTPILEEKKFAFAPKNLFININRASIDKRTKESKFIKTAVTIPFSLKLNQNHFETDQSASYALSSFIKFVDNVHYISYVKKGNEWFKCNDGDVKRISLNEAMNASKTAYLIHFKKLNES